MAGYRTQVWTQCRDREDTLVLPKLTKEEVKQEALPAARRHLVREDSTGRPGEGP